MIPHKMMVSELAKAETEVAQLERRVAQQRERLRVFTFYERSARDLAEQILAVLEAALKLAYAQRDRLLGSEPPQSALLQHSRNFENCESRKLS